MEPLTLLNMFLSLGFTQSLHGGTLNQHIDHNHNSSFLVKQLVETMLTLIALLVLSFPFQSVYYKQSASFLRLTGRVFK